ncbi:MAG: glucosidase, partial [Fimbriimonadaceae bacterium]
MTEQERLAATARKEGDWDRWGPYLAERAWGTVREDYSPDGSAWGYFPHDHARSRAYRWTEDGLAGISDRKQRVCLAFALWNEKDPILKERLFGLSGTEGNHAEDVKELYYYVDNSPSHTYMKFLYKYPQAEFPYRELVDVNASRYKQGFEYELVDTGVLDEDRYFDFFVEYAKPLAEDMLLEAYAANRSPETAPLHLLPQIWFRNDWTWFPNTEKPRLTIAKETKEFVCLKAEHPKLGTRYLYVEGAPELLFTENETNFERCFNSPNQSEFVKDAFHARVIG